MEQHLIESFRETHHALARMYASGMSEVLIRRMTGFTTRRLSILYNTPAFAELIAYYQDKAEEHWKEHMDVYHGYMYANQVAAERHIHETIEELEEAGERLPLGTANRISMDRADRTGYGKNSKVEIKMDFASSLDRAITESNKARVIEGKAIEPKVIGTDVGTPSHVDTVSSQEVPAPPRTSLVEPGPPRSARPKVDFVGVLTKRKI